MFDYFNSIFGKLLNFGCQTRFDSLSSADLLKPFLKESANRKIISPFFLDAASNLITQVFERVKQADFSR